MAIVTRMKITFSDMHLQLACATMICALVACKESRRANDSQVLVDDGDRASVPDGPLAENSCLVIAVSIGRQLKNEKGEKETWAIEWGAAGQLNLTGGKEALKFGDPVVVIGNPGRNPEAHRMRMVTITRTSDGWKWGGSFN